MKKVLNEQPWKQRRRGSGKNVYDEAFRREAVSLLESSPEPLSELAARLGASHWNLRDWRKRYGSAQSGRKAEGAVRRPDLRIKGAAASWA